MSMSQEAAEGLRATVEYNPAAAQFFMHALLFLPEGVRYKEQDRYGPLALMISASPSGHTCYRYSQHSCKEACCFSSRKASILRGI